MISRNVCFLSLALISSLSGCNNPAASVDSIEIAVDGEAAGNNIIVGIQNNSKDVFCFSRSELFATRNFEELLDEDGNKIRLYKSYSFPERILGGIDVSDGIMVVEPGNQKFLFELDDLALQKRNLKFQPRLRFAECIDIFRDERDNSFIVEMKGYANVAGSVQSGDTIRN